MTAVAAFRTSTAAGLAPMVLVEEISHRVMNEYSAAIAAIGQAALGLADAKARSALRDAAQRLRAYAEAHRALQAPPSTAHVDLGAYLERLCDSLAQATLRDRGVTLTLVQARGALPSDHCWRVGLAVAELVTNAVRHGLRGGPGHIVVTLQVLDGDFVCRVQDNGGVTGPSPGPGRGRAVVEGLVADLCGEVDWSFSRRGTCVTLTLPATEIQEG